MGRRIALESVEDDGRERLVSELGVASRVGASAQIKLTGASPARKAGERIHASEGGRNVGADLQRNRAGEGRAD